MSNMIKAYAVCYDEVLMKTIDTHLRDKEIATKRKAISTAHEEGNEFVEGLKAIVVEKLPTEEEQKEISGKIIQAAKKEAVQILELSKQEAEKSQKDLYAASQKKGYEDGMLQSNREARKLQEQYDEKAKQLQKEYEEMAAELEPRMTEIISSLVEKITGVVVGDKEEVILHLVDKALKNLDKSSEYTIRVSKSNFEFLSSKKSILLGAIGREVSLYITEDASLKKNQCLIETDLHIINCSLDVQLSNLITELKLLGGV